MNTDYIPLYRKYRPQKIEEIVGQEHIKKALANAIQMDRISHAYLFTGPRGTGKTSTARIFAKSLNCMKGMSISPCNECENCKNITNSIPIDVIEIDAASNRSVSDADDIIQKVALAPVQSRYKIYIIDEVHMLSNQAFNALLKTLEEPPKNVIFILATTEVHKVLDTIKSRCQRFDFKRITTDDIIKHLKYIADNEKINITDDALAYIAQNSAGGMRDSIALLDQLSILNSSKDKITVDDINSLLGRISFASLTELFGAIICSDKSKALDILNDIYNSGNDPIQILSNLLEYYRNALILLSAQDVDNAVVQLNKEQKDELKQKLESIECHQLISLINKCSEYIKELKLTQNPKLFLDVAILDMANLTKNTKLEDLQKRISMLESGEPIKVVNTSPYNTPPQPVKKEIPSATTKVLSSETVAPAKKIDTKTVETKKDDISRDDRNIKVPESDNIRELWAKLLDNISSFPSRTILKQQAIPVKLDAEEVIISIKTPNWLKQFGPDGEKYSYIVEATSKLFGKPVGKVIVRGVQSGDGALRKGQNTGNGTKQPDTSKQPEKKVEEEITQEEFEEVLGAAEEKSAAPVKPTQNYNKFSDSINHSDNVNMVMELFEGKMID